MITKTIRQTEKEIGWYITNFENQEYFQSQVMELDKSGSRGFTTLPSLGNHMAHGSMLKQQRIINGNIC